MIQWVQFPFPEGYRLAPEILDASDWLLPWVNTVKGPGSWQKAAIVPRQGRVRTLFRAY